MSGHSSAASRFKRERDEALDYVESLRSLQQRLLERLLDVEQERDDLRELVRVDRKQRFKRTRELKVFPDTLIPASPAKRLEMLEDLYSPMQYDAFGNPIGRNPKFGLISAEEFIRLADFPDIESVRSPKRTGTG